MRVPVSFAGLYRKTPFSHLLLISMPKYPTAPVSRMAFLRRALETLRVVWSDQPRYAKEATTQRPQASRTRARDVRRPWHRRMKPPSLHKGKEPSPEPWITKQRLAEHLSVTPRWIELQQRLGLPHIHTPGLNRYRISEVETWLREQYGWPQGP
jgi:hypothetical protein